MRAIGNYVVIEPIKAEKKDKLIMTLDDDRIRAWFVVSVGKDVKEVKVGDQVVVTSYSNRDIVIEDKTYSVVEESNIYAVI